MQKKTINTGLKKTGKYFFLPMLIAFVFSACKNDDAKPKGEIINPSISIEPAEHSAFKATVAQSSGSGAAEAANIDQIPGGFRSETKENDLSKGDHAIKCDAAKLNRAPQATDPDVKLEKLAQSLFAQSNFYDCEVRRTIEQEKKLENVTEKEIDANTKEYTAKWGKGRESNGKIEAEDFAIIKWVVNKKENTMVVRYVNVDPQSGAKTLIKAKVTKTGKEISSVVVSTGADAHIALAFFKETIKTAADGKKFKEQEVYGRASAIVGYTEGGSNFKERFVNTTSARYVEGKGSFVTGRSCEQGIPLNDYTADCSSEYPLNSRYFDENQRLSTTNTIGINSDLNATLETNLKKLFPVGSSEATVFTLDFEVSLGDNILE